MTEKQDKTESSSEERVEDLLKFKLPEVSNVEVFLIKLKDGTVVARTKDELDASAPGEKA